MNPALVYSGKKVLFALFCILQGTFLSYYFYLQGADRFRFKLWSHKWETRFQSSSVNYGQSKKEIQLTQPAAANDGFHRINFQLTFKASQVSENHERSILDVINRLRRPPFSDIVSLEGIRLDYKPEGGNRYSPHPWYLLPDKLSRLSENPIYQKFDVPKMGSEKSKVDVLIIVSTAPGRRERRQGIRESWWSECKSTARITVHCVFITDKREANTSVGKELLEESRKYQDIVFQNLKGGAEFGMRFLFHSLWAIENFNFSYMIRMDDDYFLCLHEILSQMPMPAKTNYHWGYLHCEGAGLVWPDESLVLFSRDIIEEFLGQDPNKMLCHPQADQMISIWKQELGMTFPYNGDTRLHHHPPASHLPQMQKLHSVCNTYLGVHGSYPKLMKQLWQRRGKGQWSSYDLYLTKCPHHDFRWDFIQGYLFSYLPKLCVNNPTWNTLRVGKPGEMFVGREKGVG